MKHSSVGAADRRRPHFPCESGSRLHLDEGGSAVAEIAVLIPIAMLVVLFAVQMAIWAHAATLVQNAATQGERVATESGGSSSAAVEQAGEMLTATAGDIVLSPSVNVTRLPGDMVQLRITGSAEAIIPWLRLPVSAVRVGTLQEFRTSG